MKLFFAVLVITTFGFMTMLPSSAKTYDLIIRNGTIYDGSGKKPVVGDVAVTGDTIAKLGNLKRDQGKTEIDATGLAVSPGFINMLSWATESLIHDGRSQSDTSVRASRWKSSAKANRWDRSTTP